MKYVILFGPPGCGKGTQSEKIVAKYGFGHISTGDVLRGEIAKQSELGKIAKEYIDKGALIPDDLIIDMLEKSLNELPASSTGVIPDGFPRTTAQAAALKTMLAKRNESISAVLNLTVPDEELVVRLINRGKVSGRSDDNMETIQKRLKTYYDQSFPVIDFYKAEGCLNNIEGVGTIDEIFDRVCKVIG
jgi:adenylate kinase